MFWKIIGYNYSDEEIGMFTWWSDELMKDLDIEIASNLKWDSTGEFDPKISVPYDFEKEWDFPEPPEFLQ